MGLHFTSASANQFITFGSPAAIDSADPITVAAIFRKTEAVHDILVGLYFKQDTTSGNGIALTVHDGAIWATTTMRLTISRATTNAEARISNTLSVDNWYLVVATFDGTNGPKIYIADLTAGTTPVEGTYDVQTTGSGARTSDATGDCTYANQSRPSSRSNSAGFRGDIDTVGLWAAELSLTDVRELVHGSTGVWASRTGAVLVSKLWNTTQQANISGGAASDGTNTGGTLAINAPRGRTFMFGDQMAYAVAAAADVSPGNYYQYYLNMIAGDAA